MPKVYKHEFTVTEDVVDVNGHVNNVAYIKWMQDVAILHSKAQGFGIKEYRGLGVTWVVRSHYIEYFTPAFSGDKISILTWVANISRARSLRKYKFIRADNLKLLAKAETNWVYLNIKTNRPCIIHEEVVNAFEVVAGDEEP
jgi:acyl-CoA thioester hydrolase